MKKLVFLFAIACAVSSCEKVKEKAGETIDSGAKVVGKTASDVVNSIDKGITESASLDIQLSEDLKKSGLSFGKYYFRNNDQGDENMISLYLITDKDFNRDLSLKLFDKKGVEMGRTSLKVAQKKGRAGYFDFVFDPKIEFEYQGKLIIE